MDFKPILLKKAAKVRKRTYYAYLGILAFSFFVAFLLLEGDYWPAYSTFCKVGLAMSEAIILSAFLLAQYDFKIKPEQSTDEINLAKIRNGAFLLVWEWILLCCVLLWPSFFFLFPLFMLFVYACCIQTLHFYFNAVLHPMAPKSILLALPIDQPFRSCPAIFFLGCIWLLLSLIALVVGLLPPGMDTSLLLLALFFFILAALLIVPTAAAMLGHIQAYEEWLWLVLMAFSKKHGATAMKAQFPLFVWCMSHPGNPNPPLDLLMKADENFLSQNFSLDDAHSPDSWAERQ